MRATPTLFRALGGFVAITLSTAALGASAPGTATAVPRQVWAVSDLVRCKPGSYNHPGARDVVATIDAPIALPGDLVAPSGTTEQFATCFDPLWGGLKARMHPTPGNHEYNTYRAEPYYAYFDVAPYYAWWAGSWQMFSVTSMCGHHGGCGVGSPMYRWLETRLQAQTGVCQAVYWHHPRWSQGMGGNIEKMAPLYELIDRYDVELLLAGNENGVYERYAALDGLGRPNPRGVTEFVVSTGGVTDGAGRVTANVPSPVVRHDGTRGALLLTLAASTWSAEYVAEAGSNLTDSASGTCFRPA